MPDLFTGYQTQVEAILEKIHSRAGHILVYGNKGVGKTTLLKWLTEKLKDEFMTIYIPRPTENFEEQTANFRLVPAHQIAFGVAIGHGRNQFSAETGDRLAGADVA